MYRDRRGDTSDVEDEEQQQQQFRSRPASTQYPAGMNVHFQGWQDSSTFFGAQSTGFLTQSGVPANYPVGSGYNPGLGWMEQFNDVPSEITDPATGNFGSHAASLQRTASAPVAAQPTPIVPSQRQLIGSAEASTDPRSVIPFGEAGQPGSSSAAAAASQISRRSTPSGRHPSRSRLEEENRLLLDLRDRQRLPWREVTRQFEQTYGREYRMPTLQMRYGRLRSSASASRPRQWTDADTDALRQAANWYMEERWKIISERMQHYGASEQWTPEECEAYWRQISSGARQPARGGSGS